MRRAIDHQESSRRASAIARHIHCVAGRALDIPRDERRNPHRREDSNPSQNGRSTIACMDERTTTQIAYAERLERVFRWLADHLDDTLDLTRLADVACLSPYHFHRVYRAMQGETAADTVRRMRLHRAAVELITGELPVPRVARRAGYGSQEAFTRAFRAAYGVPPARYRASFVPPQTPHRQEDAMDTATYDATIRTTPTLRVATLAHRGEYQTIGSTFQRLMTMAAAQGLLGADGRTFGIYYDDPSATPVGALRSDACVVVADGREPSGELQLKEIRGGRYATVLHVGPYAELDRPYKWLYGTWLAQSGEEPADAPVVESYLNDARTVPPTALQTEIWLPLR
jgi:AraC family transcriptional regulator